MKKPFLKSDGPLGSQRQSSAYHFLDAQLRSFRLQEKQ
jgi:hypothetical protein